MGTYYSLRALTEKACVKNFLSSGSTDL
jgi:hypothetical protein